MKKTILLLTLFAVITANFTQAQDVVITEISYNPAESGADSTEYIELYNKSNMAVSLDGYQFTSGIVFTFPTGVTILPSGYLVVAVDSIAVQNSYGVTGVYQWTSGGLSNGGESIALKDDLGNLIDSLRYDDIAPWPTSPDGSGTSLVLCDPESNNTDGSNWTESTSSAGITVNGNPVFGSPGAADAACSPCTPVTGTDVQHICDAASYDWIDGNTYTSDNNTAMHTIVAGAANGCDSIVTLNLTFGVSATGTDVQHVCDVNSYDWIDGNTYTTDNNTATHTIVGGAANGCDSVVTLNLTFGVSATGTDIQTACVEYTWIDGNTYTTSNNSATHTIVGGAANGCDSVVTLNLTINTVDVSVTANDPQITANATGAAYVWLDCDDNYSVITDETNQMFTATANGNYAVEVTENGCTDTSACTAITTVGIEDFDLFGEVAVYPNPTNGLVNIDLGAFTGASVQVIDLNGKVVYMNNNASGLFTFELNQAPGIYMVEVRIEDDAKRFKVIKE